MSLCGVNKKLKQLVSIFLCFIIFFTKMIKYFVLSKRKMDAIKDIKKIDKEIDKQERTWAKRFKMLFKCFSCKSN